MSVEEELRDLRIQLIEINRQVAGLDVAMIARKEGQQDIKTMMLDIGRTLVLVEREFNGVLDTLQRNTEHIKRHCVELDTIKLAMAGARGTIRGAALAGAAFVSVVTGFIAAGWALITHFGFFGKG